MRWRLGAGLVALGLTAGCSSHSNGSAGKPNGIGGQSVDRVFTRVDKALDATSVHTKQVSGGRKLADVHAIHGGDRCTGLLTDDTGYAWHFITLGERIWVTPERRSAKLADGTGAQVEPGRYLPVEVSSPGFAGTLAQHTSGGCHMRFSTLKQQHVVVTKGAESRMDGRPVLAVNAEQGDVKSTVYLATTGDPVPLRVVGRAGKESFTTTWEDYGVAPTISAPPKSKTLPPLT
ncbi:hypothetical protein [Streptomyces sp. NPDC007074]|uniref:hypothetical protein n=1 Tax=Streptomyces sp. NPDC007074 TaxID=3156764 RepID=UPI0033C96277